MGVELGCCCPNVFDIAVACVVQALLWPASAVPYPFLGVRAGRCGVGIELGAVTFGPCTLFDAECTL